MTARLLVGLAIGGMMSVLVAACSPGADFPAIHDMPAPRADTPMNPDQVKQATDALISERNQLSADTQSNGQPSAAPNAAPAAGRSTPQAVGQPLATSSTQTTGATAKP